MQIGKQELLLSTFPHSLNHVLDAGHDLDAGGSEKPVLRKGIDRTSRGEKPGKTEVERVGGAHQREASCRGKERLPRGAAGDGGLRS